MMSNTFSFTFKNNFCSLNEIEKVVNNILLRHYGKTTFGIILI